MVQAPLQNLPWVEKYRPKTLDELISHTDILSTITRFVDEGKLPHLLLYGPPGTGKTTTLLAVAQKLYPTKKEFTSNVLELNASDDRGIGVVREQIINFSSTRQMFCTGYKLVILDEADAMTKDAQNALRRVIEKYTANVRFCLICNYLSKIIPALQSRATRFRFAPLSTAQMLPRLKYVQEQEKLNVTLDGEKALLTLANGDMRRVFNVLQSTSMAFDVVNEENVYICVGHALKSDVKFILNSLLNHTFAQAVKNISLVKVDKGLALADIITQVHTYILRLDIAVHIQVHIVENLAEIEHRLASGASEKIQLVALISVFQQARAMIQKEAQAKIEHVIMQ